MKYQIFVFDGMSGKLMCPYLLGLMSVVDGKVLPTKLFLDQQSAFDAAQKIDSTYLWTILPMYYSV